MPRQATNSKAAPLRSRLPKNEPKAPTSKSPWPMLHSHYQLAECGAKFCGWPLDPLTARSEDYARKILDELSLGLHEYLLGWMMLAKQGQNEIHMKLPENAFLWAKPGDTSSMRVMNQDDSEHLAAKEACNVYGISLPYKLNGRAVRYGFTKVFYPDERLKDLEAFEAQNLLKVFIGVLKNKSCGCASICRKLLLLDSWFKHRTYLTQYLWGACACPTAKVTEFLGACCRELEDKLVNLRVKSLKEFSRAQGHFKNIRDLARLAKLRAMEGDGVQHILSQMQQRSDERLEQVMACVVGTRFNLSSLPESPEHPEVVQEDDEDFQKAVDLEVQHNLAMVEVPRHGSFFQVVDASGVSLVDALQRGLDIVVMKLRCMLVHLVSLPENIQLTDETWHIIKELAEYKPTYGMDVRCECLETNPPFIFFKQSQEFQDMKKNQHAQDFEDTWKQRWREAAHSRSGNVVEAIEESTEDLESDSVDGMSKLPDVMQLHEALFGEQICHQSPYLNDPFFVFRTLNHSLYEIAKDKGMGQAESRPWDDMAKIMKRLSMLRDGISHHMSLNGGSCIKTSSFLAAARDMDEVMTLLPKLLDPENQLGLMGPTCEVNESSPAMWKASALWQEYQQTFVQHSPKTVFSSYTRSVAKLRHLKKIGVQPQSSGLDKELLQALDMEGFQKSPEMAVLKECFKGIKIKPQRSTPAPKSKLRHRNYWDTLLDSQSEDEESESSSGSSDPSPSSARRPFQADNEAVRSAESGEPAPSNRWSRRAVVQSTSHFVGAETVSQASASSRQESQPAAYPRVPQPAPQSQALAQSTSHFVGAETVSQASASSRPESQPAAYPRAWPQEGRDLTSGTTPEVTAWVETLGGANAALTAVFRKIAAKIGEDKYTGGSLNLLTEDDLREWNVPGGPRKMLLREIKKLYDAGA